MEVLYQSVLISAFSKNSASSWLFQAKAMTEGCLSCPDRTLILMFLSLSPIFFLILSGFLKITAP